MSIDTGGPARQDVTLQFAGTAVDILVPGARTDGAFSLLQLANPPGCWTPPHRHRDEDETLLVLSGAMRAETQDGCVVLQAGQAVTLPRGRAHRLGNPGGEEARLLVLCTPGGFEDFVREAGRPLASAEDLAMTGADVERLVRAAPRHGIELLGADALPAAATLALTSPAVPGTLDVLGMAVQVLAEPGAGEDGVALMRGRLPPHGVVPLHGHPDREVLCVLDGTLDVSLGPVGGARWHRIRRGGVVDVAGGVPHALRNPGDAPVDIALVATRRIAGLFREVGCPPDAVPPGPPSPARLARLVQASLARGCWLAGERENAAIGLALPAAGELHA